jgi:multicomponent Na+:H+ antiporter subunit B
MKSLISYTALRLLIPLFLVYSFYLLFRGHNLPGGGFIGGLVASLPFVFYAMMDGPEKTQKKFRIDPVFLVALGLGMALVSAMLSMFMGDPFMTSIWPEIDIPVIGHPSSPLLFDIGVYLVVVGIVLKITFLMAEE